MFGTSHLALGIAIGYGYGWKDAGARKELRGQIVDRSVATTRT
jgi:hypothetical protein